MITNVHSEEVLYREEDESLDPASAGTSFLRATETWEELGLPQNLIDALYEAGYDYPSKIQKVTLKMFSTIEDLQKLVAQSHTGSGKTAAFALASLLKVDVAVKSPQVVVFCHTIELSHQITAEFNKFAVCLGVEVSLLSRATTAENIGQVVVGTDGSIQRMIKAGALKLAHLKVVVLDEADHMLNPSEKGDFYNELKRWKESAFPPTTIYLLFSATFNPSIIERIEDLLEDHYEIKIKVEDLVLANIKQFYYRAKPGQNKIEVADSLLKTSAKGLTIMFCNTCKYAEQLFKNFSDKGHRCALLIGRNMSLAERGRTMNDFMEGKYTLLITTNLLARGIDNKLVKNIINFDMPIDHATREINYELYIHRIGRCGRFGRHGIAITIAENEEEMKRVTSISDHYSCTIEEVHSEEHLDQINEERERKEKEEEEVKE
jgi:ATP-dependent RNA helicase DDX19/DBP5